MSWFTCSWCNARLNGRGTYTKHRLQKHPTEYQNAMAQTALQGTEQNLKEAQEELVRYDAIVAELDTNLPPIARRLLEQECRRLVFPTTGTSARDILCSTIRIRQDRVRQAQARVAALTTSPQAR